MTVAPSGWPDVLNALTSPDFPAMLSGVRRRREREAGQRAEDALAEALTGRYALYFPLGCEQMDDYCCDALDRDSDITEHARAVGGEFESTGNRFVNAAESEGRTWSGGHALSGSDEDWPPCVLFVALDVDTAALADEGRVAANAGVRVFPARPDLPATTLSGLFHDAGLSLDDFEPDAPTVTRDWDRALVDELTGAPAVWDDWTAPVDDSDDCETEPVTDATNYAEDDRPSALDLVALRTEPRPLRTMLETEVITEGQVTKFTAASGVGKSLLLADMAIRWSLGHSALDREPDGRHRELDSGPLRVMYVDGELGDDWWHDYLDRFEAPLELPNLFVISMQSFAPLTTTTGAVQLAELVERYRPDVIILDTLSSFIDGAENDADTWIAFDNRITLPLKAMGKTVIYADHSGKDPGLGARGSSAKRSKLDAEWSMTIPRSERPGELTLSRLKARHGGLPEHVRIRRLDNPLGHVRLVKDGSHRIAVVVDEDVSSVEPFAPPRDARVAELVAELDRLEAPTTAGRDKARREFAGRVDGQFGTQVWTDAIGHRKARAAAQTDDTEGPC